MNNITFTASENRWALNNFNFLALNVTNLIMPINEMTNMHMVYN